MGLADLIERKGLSDLDSDCAGADDVEQSRCGSVELLGGGDIVEQGRPGHEQRPTPGQSERLQRRHRPRGVPIGYEQPTTTQAVE